MIARTILPYELMAPAASQTRRTPATRQYPAPLRRWLASWLLLGGTAASDISSGQRCSHIRPMMVSDSTARWVRHSINEHMPAGELVVSISEHEFQGLPLGYSHELRSRPAVMPLQSRLTVKAINWFSRYVETG